MTVKIKTTKLDDKATLKNVLLKLENGKLNHLGTWPISIYR